MTEGKKIYFASDFHLGMDGRLSSRERELQLLRWLDEISADAEELFLVGDLFDFWFEYRSVVPRGFVRFLGKLAAMRDSGLPVHVFIGNHDMWMFDYFERELGIPVHRGPVVREFAGKTFFIGHGDGLGPADYGYKCIKKVFRSPFCQWLFGILHPDVGVGLANYLSGRSRASNPPAPKFLGEGQEWLIAYCHRKLETVAADYFVFGHRHLPIDFTLKNGTSRYINLGDWLYYNTYAVFDGTDLQLVFFDRPEGEIFGRAPLG
ncbi:MAG: UDP-2,3-diacylglucosamine diphosphatase [Saprospiraceae bacterium]|jgi:UDP-2,3-diacylglucosamine hydrolase